MFKIFTKKESVTTIINYRVLNEGEAPLFKTNAELEIIRPQQTLLNSAFNINNTGLKMLKHREMLFNSKDAINCWWDDDEVKVLQNAGFKWFVFPEFINQFKYHASLSNRRTVVHQHRESKFNPFAETKDIIYAGDIPDNSLKRIETAKYLNLYKHHNIYDEIKRDGLEYFSIHSMQPMPIDIRISDPVVIAWKFWDSIWLESNGKLCSPNSWERNSMGVIITAWDIENELR